LKFEIFNEFEMIKIAPKKYDLEERTANFAKADIKYCSGIPKNPVTIPLISQLVRAATSIGANYCEANGASSKRDFINKIFICKKESKETKYWIQLIAETQEIKKEEPRLLWREAQELTMIFSKIAGSAQMRDKSNEKTIN
jgi:four helix bundle protein